MSEAMIRCFESHEIRLQQELDGMWEFEPVKDDVIPNKFQYKMHVPGCWEEHPAFSSYRGRAAYRKKFSINEKKFVRFEFKGVSHTADVFLDGQKIAHHYNAYTPFSFGSEELIAGEHEIIVIADNSFSNRSALHVPNDYYTYGGIIRPVIMETVSKVFVKRITFVPEYAQGKWKAEISVVLHNLTGRDLSVRVEGTLAGQRIDFGTFTASGGRETTFVKNVCFDDILSWSSEYPNLYLLKTFLFLEDEEEPADDLTERVGFREVKLRNEKLLLNGKEIFLKGFCRHEDFAMVGCAIPPQLMALDIEMLLNAGANAVRTTHYPNDERFLDMCDERGIFVYEENHARGIGVEGMKNENFEPQCEACNEEMILAHFNHPSIIIWGLLNECASDTSEGRDLYEKQIKQIKELDASRPVTFATCQHYHDLCLEMADIVSLNIYSRWYSDRDPGKDFEEILGWVRKNGGNGKPIFISEFGAEGLYGNHSPEREYWSEESQSDILEEALKVYLHHDKINGTFVWQYCDNRVTDGIFRTRRSGMVNQKGAVDLYRRPKLSYYTIKKYYDQFLPLKEDG